MDNILIDKALPNGKDMTLGINGDISVVQGTISVLQAAQLRCLSYFGSWLHNDTLGSSMRNYLHDTNVYAVTEEALLAIVNSALKDMLADGRIAEVKGVKILSRDSDSISLEIKVITGNEVGYIPLVINN